MSSRLDHHHLVESQWQLLVGQDTTWVTVQITCLKLNRGPDALKNDNTEAVPAWEPAADLEITDEAVQMHGAMGVTQDVPLARMWTGLRTLRLADGPDAVHRRQVARAELRRYTNQKM